MQHPLDVTREGLESDPSVVNDPLVQNVANFLSGSTDPNMDHAEAVQAVSNLLEDRGFSVAEGSTGPQLYKLEWIDGVWKTTCTQQTNLTLSDTAPNPGLVMVNSKVVTAE